MKQLTIVVATVLAIGSALVAGSAEAQVTENAGAEGAVTQAEQPPMVEVEADTGLRDGGIALTVVGSVLLSASVVGLVALPIMLFVSQGAFEGVGIATLVAFGAGLSALIAGIVMMVVGSTRSTRQARGNEPSFALLPSVTTESAGLALVGSF